MDIKHMTPISLAACMVSELKAGNLRVALEMAMTLAPAIGNILGTSNAVHNLNELRAIHSSLTNGIALSSLLISQLQERSKSNPQSKDIFASLMEAKIVHTAISACLEIVGNFLLARA